MSDLMQDADGIDLTEEPKINLKVPCRGRLYVEYVTEEAPVDEGIHPPPDEPSSEIKQGLAKLEAMSHSELRKWVHKHFSFEDLWTIIDDLEIDEATFKCDTRNATIRGMIDYCKRRGLLNMLLTEFARQRVNLLTTDT